MWPPCSAGSWTNSLPPPPMCFLQNPLCIPKTKGADESPPKAHLTSVTPVLSWSLRP